MYSLYADLAERGKDTVTPYVIVVPHLPSCPVLRLAPQLLTWVWSEDGADRS